MRLTELQIVHFRHQLRKVREELDRLENMIRPFMGEPKVEYIAKIMKIVEFGPDDDYMPVRDDKRDEWPHA